MKIISVLRILKWQLQKYSRFIMELKTIFWLPRKSIDLTKLFAQFEDKIFYFIQVGANDGITGDDLRRYIEKYKWHGILIEPVPYVFERLKNNYSKFSNLIFENVAISQHSGFANFYSISEKDLDNKNLFENYDKYKLDQLSSFDKDTLMKHSYMHPDFEHLINIIQIPTLTLIDLFKKYEVKKIDLLQVDAEGFDFEILNAIDFKTVSPNIIIFEHQHMNLCDYKSLIGKIKKSGYKSFKSNWDTVSVKREICFGI